MYYPKSQITTDLITNGKEFVISNTTTLYSGFYFITGDGKIFSGKNPNEKPNIRLEKVSINLDAIANATAEEEILPDSYNIIDDSYFWARGIDVKSINIPPSPPTQIYALPTELNYEVGEFQRYFVKKTNETKYVEISYSEYEKYLNQEQSVDFIMYTPFQLPWVISGNRNNVANVNKNTIERISKSGALIGFKSYFKDNYTQYFRYTSTSNLTTNGTEFLNERTGKNYVGLYHIHPQKGPMVGAQHTPQFHDYLVPISGSNLDYKVNKIETQNSQRNSRRY